MRVHHIGGSREISFACIHESGPFRLFTPEELERDIRTFAGACGYPYWD